MSENNSLISCERHVHRVEMLIKQAQRIQPAVRNIGDMRIAQMNFMTNVVFENIFSDMQSRDRIKQSETQLKIAQASLAAELKSSRESSLPLQTEFEEAKARLDQKRAELQHVRSRAFERLASERELGERRLPPPIKEEEVKC